MNTMNQFRKFSSIYIAKKNKAKENYTYKYLHLLLLFYYKNNNIKPPHHQDKNIKIT